MSLFDAARRAAQGLLMRGALRAVALAPDRWMPGHEPRSAHRARRGTGRRARAAPGRPG